jgi:hypothetical protein
MSDQIWLSRFVVCDALTDWLRKQGTLQYKFNGSWFRAEELRAVDLALENGDVKVLVEKKDP